MGEIPVSIPNTTVKPHTADGTMLETAWESRGLPGFFIKKFQDNERLQGIAVSDGLEISKIARPEA